MATRDVQNILFQELPTNGVNNISLKSPDALSANYVLSLPAITDTIISDTSSSIITNKTITDASNNVSANSLKTTGADVNVSLSIPPLAGSVLTATSPTTAIWSFPSTINASRTVSVLSEYTTVLGYGIGPIILPIAPNSVGNSATSNYTITRASEFTSSTINVQSGFATAASTGGTSIGSGGVVGGFTIRAKIAISNCTASTRFICGLSSSSTSVSFGTAVNIIGVGFDGVDGTSTFQIVHGGSVISTINTGIVIGSGVKYIDFVISVAAGSNILNYSVVDCNDLTTFSGSAALVLGTSLPSTTTMLGMISMITGLTVTNVSYRFAYMYLETPNQ